MLLRLGGLLFRRLPAEVAYELGVSGLVRAARRRSRQVKSTGFSTMSRAWKSAAGSVRHEQLDATQSDRPRYLRGGPHAAVWTPYLPTDGGNAERFAAEHGHEVRYCHAWGKWLVWDGQRWAIDDRGRLHQLAKDTARGMLGEAATEIDDEKRKNMQKRALTTDSRPRREAMIALAASEDGIPVIPDELDLDPWLLNVQNGTIDLRIGELLLHRREDLITKLAPVDYNPAATAPRWLQFLEEVMPDPDLRRFVQAAVGYSLNSVT